MATGAYILTHAPSGFFYIGSSIDLVRRIREHKSDLLRGTHGNPKLSRCFTCWEDCSYKFFETENIDVAHDLETDLIRKHSSNPLCCNVGTDARNRVAGVIDDEARRRGSLGHTRNLGRTHSEETKARIGAASLGRTKSPEVRQKIAAAKSKKISIEGTIYDSVKDAALKLNMPYTTVSGRLKSTRYQKWFFIE